MNVVKESTKFYQTSNKSSLRTTLLKKRLSLSNQEVSFKSNYLSNLFINDVIWNDDIEAIALYFPIKSEISTRIVHQKLISKNKKVFYPKIINNKINFIQPNNLEDFSLGKFKIHEPNGDNFVSINNIDLFVIPSIGIGKNGKRLGYGGGYYDRLLSEVTKDKLCSFIYDFQYLQDFIGESHDIEVSKTYTDTNILYFN